MKYKFMRFPEGKTKAVTFSYDDNGRSDLRMRDVFDKYGMKCTFNVTSYSATNGNGVSIAELKESIAKGHEIAIHGATHAALGNLRPIDGIKEVLECRRILEQELSMIIRGYAYADSGIGKMVNGASYEDIRHYLSDLDIAYARAISGDNDRFHMPTDWYAWMPTAHHTNPSIMKYIEKFLSIDVDKCYCGERHPRLFYIWGHSFEFNNNDNWELLDEICAALAGKEDTWYATNMEIYNYSKAYESLSWSVDNKRVYNPSLITVWFDIDGKLYSIKSGETLEI